MDFQADKLNAMSEYLAEEFSMGAEEVNEMLDIFFDSMGELISSAESQIKDSATDQLAATGHAIKGSAANINATGISSIGLAIENSGKAGDLSACQEAVDAFKTAMAQLKSSYEQ